MSARNSAYLIKEIHYNTFAREWRCVWSEDDDKRSLTELQRVLEEPAGQMQRFSIMYLLILPGSIRQVPHSFKFQVSQLSLGWFGFSEGAGSSCLSSNCLADRPDFFGER